MSVDLTELQSLRDALVRARAKGVREAQINGERVRYGSDAEMASAIAGLDAEIRRATTARPATVSFSTSKGM